MVSDDDVLVEGPDVPVSGDASPVVTSSRRAVDDDGEPMPVRDHVLTYLQRRSGATIKDVAAAVGKSPNTAKYHLDALYKAGAVVRKRDGSKLRHFVASEYTDEDRLLPFLRNEKHRSIIDALLRQEVPRSLNQVATDLGVQHAYSKRAVLRLVEDGFVSLDKRGSRYTVHRTRKLLEAFRKIHDR